MPTNTSTHPPPKPSEAGGCGGKHKGLDRCIFFFLAAVVFVVGVTVVVLWIVIKPRRLLYNIEYNSVQNFSLSNSLLNYTFDFVIVANNPNRRATINYKWIKVSAAYEDHNIGNFNTLEPFHQPTRNVTRLKTRLVVQNEVVSESLREALNRTNVTLDVHVNAKIQFKVGIWKSRDRNLTVSCFRELKSTLSENSRRCFIDL